MKLAFGQLERHLSSDLAHFYLVAGDEPLLVAEALEQIRAAARRRGFEERELHVVDRGFRWVELESGADNMSLFASRRITELRLPSARPGDAGAKAIRALAEDTDPDPDRMILVGIYDKLDSRAAWVRSVERHATVVEIRPVGREALPGFIRARAEKHGLALTPEGAAALAERVEGNLLAADQELVKIALTAPGRKVDEHAVLDSVANSARFDVFRLTDAVLNGETRRALRILSVLRDEGVEPPLVSWAVVRDLTLLLKLKFALGQGEREAGAMRKHRVWRSREAIVRKALRRLSSQDLTRALARAVEVDATIKGVRAGRPWDSLTDLVIGMLEPSRARPPVRG